MKENIIIRLERENEYHEVENLVRESFWNVYRPGCLEHYVLHQLRNDPAFVPELDFVMTLDGQLIGQNMYMKAVIAVDDGRSMRNEFPIKKLALILVGAATLPELFDSIKLQYKLVLSFFHLEDAGMVLVQGAKDIGDVKNTDGLDRAYELGLSIG